MELYHLLNRGVDKRDLFMEDRDYLRFVHDMWEFNDVDATSHAIHTFKHLDLRSPNFPKKMRTNIVEIHGWCLMKNHYHLLVSEIVEGGITKFIRKLNIGYAKYFNEKYKREGSLFQGRTKKILIRSDAHFLHILNYIHFNPLDYVGAAKEWRNRAIQNIDHARKQLETYRWSSFQDYCGSRNFPSILTTELFGETPKVFRKKAMEHLRDFEKDSIQGYRLE